MEGTCNVKHSIDTIFILSYMRIPSFFFRDVLIMNNYYFRNDISIKSYCDIQQIFEIGQSYGKSLNADKEILK